MIRAFALLVLMGCPDQKEGLTIHNTAPNAAINSPVEGASFDGGETVVFNGTVGDNEDDASDLIVTWSSDMDGVLQEGLPADSSGETTLTTGALSPGEHLIMLHVADSRGESGEDIVSVLVVDAEAAPELHILRPADDDIGSETTDFSFEAIATDAQDLGPEMQVTFWSDDGGGEMILCEATPNVDGLAVCEAGIDAGVYDIVATVIDTDGNLSQDKFKDFEVLTADEVDDDLDGFSEDEGDCDDSNDNVHPDAPEVANGIDDNCDGVIDEGTDDFDDDLDGFSEDEGDCNDDDASIYPGADEALNEIDDDCDGDVDEGTDAYDDDGDCFCEEAPCTGSIATDCEEIIESDCDDGDEDIHPDATEVCDDIDNDCDGDVDSDDADTDTDGDGYSACDSEDCNDDDGSINPDATEMCDGVDNDCDGATDGSDSADAEVWYADTDGDGFGNESISETACEAPESYVSDDSDCNDLDEDIHPDATEVCDSADTDEDCDGSADDDDPGGASGPSTWFRDVDGDGYGDSAPSSMTEACDQPTGYVANNDDCDDWTDEAHPGMVETCDGIDNNCVDGTDEEDALGCATYYLDDDGDGYGHETLRRCLCDPDYASGYDVTNNNDHCDESDDAYPGSDYYGTEAVCGSWDYNGDGASIKYWNSEVDCDAGFLSCNKTTSGWYSYVPACGSDAYWGDCPSFPDLCIPETDGTRTQKCN